MGSAATGRTATTRESAGGAEDEIRFHAARALLLRDFAAQEAGRGGASAAPGGVLLMVSLAAFVGSAIQFFDAIAVGLLVLVMLLHEAGHMLAMRLFGYRDVRMFFIPMLGAAVSGRKFAAPAWQQAAILLAGPAPGVLLGAALAWGHPPAAALAGQAALLLLLLNGFNLLPIEPLDGGRLVSVLFLSRRPAAEAACLAAGVLLLGGLSAWVAWVAWGQGAIGVAIGAASVALVAQGGLLFIPARVRLTALVRRLAAERPSLPRHPGDFAEADWRWLHAAARATVPPPPPGEPATLGPTVAAMRRLHERLAVPTPSWTLTLAAGAAQAVLLTLALWAAAWTPPAIPSPAAPAVPAEWRPSDWDDLG